MFAIVRDIFTTLLLPSLVDFYSKYEVVQFKMEPDRKGEKQAVKFYRKILDNFANDTAENHVFPKKLSAYIQGKLGKYAISLELKPVIYGKGNPFQMFRYIINQ